MEHLRIDEEQREYERLRKFLARHWTARDQRIAGLALLIVFCGCLAGLIISSDRGSSDLEGAVLSLLACAVLLAFSAAMEAQHQARLVTMEIEKLRTRIAESEAAHSEDTDRLSNTR